MIQEKAMLVNLMVSQWTASKKDKVVSKAVQQQHGASEKKAGWFNKRLIDPTALEVLGRLEGRIREFHYKLTLPWGDNGDRILPATVYMDYVNGLRKLSSEYEMATSEFVNEYPRLVQEARTMLGTMYDPADYPGTDDIARRFVVKTIFSPIPDAQDFRVDVGDEAVEEIKKNINDSISSRQHIAIKECWSRLYDVVEKIYERLSDPRSIFRDSLIDNARLLCELLPKLNITNDVNLEMIRSELEKILVNPEDIRKHKILRAKTSESAKRILEQMKVWTNTTLEK